MTSETQETRTDALPDGIDPVAPFAWETHPARERRGALCGACLGILVFALAVYGYTEELTWSFFAAIVLVISLSAFFLPTRYVLDAEGITAATYFGTKRLLWREVRRSQFGERAAWLSSALKRTWRESRHGILVLFGPRRAEILAQLRARLPREQPPRE